jgi:hypothetical protein
MEACQRCKETGQDRRTLNLSCFYALEETGIPFSIKEGTYSLRICKQCRADFMKDLKKWFSYPQERVSTGTGVFVREFGASRELTELEIKERFPKQ